MLRTAVLVVLIAWGQSLSAAEPVSDSQSNKQDIKQLLDRIRDLEQRVSQLEALAKQRGPVVPVPQSSPYPDPRSFRYVEPVPAQPYTPNGTPYSQPPARNATPLPPAVPDRKVPKTWRPFFFNGQWYYMIPVDEATADVEPSAR